MSESFAEDQERILSHSHAAATGVDEMSPEEELRQPVDLPLAVDLDGTLVQSDTLLESALRTLRTNWAALFLFPYWLSRGRAHLKQELGRRGGIDAAALPYNEGVLAYLRSAKAAGRRIALVSACDRKIAQSVADYLGLFDEILCSDGNRNLKGPAKADVLEAEFGRKRFAYAGNDASDLCVWERAGSAIIVNADRSVARRARTLAPVELEIPRATSTLLALLRAMRPYQWVKNVLVFVAPLAGHSLFEPGNAGPALATFVAFCLVASGVYLANDLVDVEADRKHLRKKARPFASGALPLSYGLFSPLLLFGGLSMAVAVSPGTAIVIAAYIALTTSYSLFLKTKPLVDVFSLSALYSLRLLAGAVATGTVVSIWLLSFSGFVFLALAFLKRSAEMMTAPRAHRRDYTTRDNNVIQTMGVASSFVSSLILALYVDSDAAASSYPAPYLLWGAVPLILFWQCRLWLSTVRGYMRDDPIVYAARDWVSWVTFACIALLFLLAQWVPPQLLGLAP